MQTVSRRGFLALGGTGAAGVALASCGGKTSERDDGDDAALLSTALTAETALGDAYAASRSATSVAFATASRKRADELTTLLEDAGGQPSDGGSSGSDPSAARANAAIAAYRAAAGSLSTEQLRGTMIAFLAAVAAELAALAELAGDDPAPFAFVTGDERKPNVAADDTPDDDETTSTTTTTQGDQ